MSVKANENRKNSVSEEENEGRNVWSAEAHGERGLRRGGGGGKLAAARAYRSACATVKFLKKREALNRMGSGEQSQP